eukprot:TRINITY_DN103352_c0_g1_i1.p1 TRINITY_DN103352_c0_g1~~TRINITY_DN103352_c0_g1_i1.p1  ORF type:complete len:419 (-),score=74.33 TRINITY_DN103352_c0_g1_i1:83-1339(-)
MTWRVPTAEAVLLALCSPVVSAAGEDASRGVAEAVKTSSVNETFVGDWGTPFASLGCPGARVADGNWVWGAGSGTYYSCNLPARGDIATMCVDANGAPDYTSIYVNMDATSAKSGCFVWQTFGCSLDLRRVRMITFDADFTQCEGTWAAPLWMSPNPWQNPAAYSGEVDFMEMCPVGDVWGNFAGGGNQLPMAPASGFGGPKSLIMTLDNSGDVAAGGTLRTQICDIGFGNCRAGSYYENFLHTVESTAGKAQGDPYVFLTDIWNGYGGDAGWTGCKAYNNPGSSCKYAIRNIRVYSTNGAPIYGGRCAAMNGDRGEGTPVSLPVGRPSEAGWTEYAGLFCAPSHGAQDLPDVGRNATLVDSDFARCKAACQADPGCNGIVTPSNGSPKCWMYAAITTSQCMPDRMYKTLAKGDVVVV